MVNYEQIERNKNKIVNIGLIIVGLIVAFQIYKTNNTKLESIIQQQNSELEKNKVIEDIATLEKKAEAYKKVFEKKDLASVMDTISFIAKDSSIKLVSVKPNSEDTYDYYSSTSFLINLIAPSYHALGNFISKIENQKDVYLVSEVTVSSGVQNPDVVTDKLDLNISLKIITVAYL